MVDFRNLKKIQSDYPESDGADSPNINLPGAAARLKVTDSAGESTTDSLVSLYHYAARYLNRLFDSVRQKDGPSLEHGFQIIKEMT